jgi:MYXO-CTERM domain-containing protein
VAGGGCSCSAEPTDAPSGTPYLSLLLLGLLWRRRGRAHPLRRGTTCR